MPVTDGYRTLMSEVRTNWDGHDQWGSVLSNLFGLAEVAYVEFDHVMPDFSPSPLRMRAQQLEDYPDSMYQDMVREGLVTQDDLEVVYRVLSRFADLIPESDRY